MAEKEITMCRMWAAVAATCLFLFGGKTAYSQEKDPPSKLPEPALQFAKGSSLRVSEMESQWLKLFETLANGRDQFTVRETGKSEASLRDDATSLLAAAKKLLDVEKRMVKDVQEFKALLKKAAAHYREVGCLYRGHAKDAKAEEVKADYLKLASIYEAKAASLLARAEKLQAPSGLKSPADVIEEGNVFIERLLELLSVGPVGEADRPVFSGRLKKHGERCKLLSDDLAKEAEKVLEGSEAPEIKDRFRGTKKLASKLAESSSKALDELSRKGPALKYEIGTLLGASWSCPVTVKGVRCLNVLRLNTDCTSSQSVYLYGSKGKGSLVWSGSATFLVDAEGTLEFYQGGSLVERGRVTFVSIDQWDYEILENASDPLLSGKRLRFTREGKR